MHRFQTHRLVRELIETNMTEEQYESNQAWLADAERVFRWAYSGYGIPHRYDEIPNEYCPDACCKHKPWLLVVTREDGVFKFGWRKRVIVLDWSMTRFTAPASELFKEENVTQYDRLIHCYGYGKALDYVRTIIKP